MENNLEKDNEKLVYEEIRSKTEKSINIEISSNKTKAYLTIKYIPGIKYLLKNDVDDNVYGVEEEYHDNNKFSKEEVAELLNKENIIFGVKNNIIEDTILNGGEKILIAEGIPAIDDEDDKIQYNFQEMEEKVDEDSLKNIDFKNITKILSVDEGQVIGKIIVGKLGRSGVNIHGKPIKKKKKKSNVFKFGEGCIVKNNIIVSKIKGRPTITKNSVDVKKAYEVKGNVDISTGNINFLGDIIINGNVQEGMEVDSEGQVIVNGNVYGAKIKAKEDINVKHSIINSEISARYNDVIKYSQIEMLNSLKLALLDLISNINFLKKKGIISEENKDGMIIKTLIETKYKNIPLVCEKIIKLYLEENINENNIIKLIKAMLVGVKPLEIKKYNDLVKVVVEIDEELKNVEDELLNSSSVVVDYCQDAKINVKGDLIVKGKGVYTTKVKAIGSIYIEKKGAVCRGGYLKAKDTIKVYSVGSKSGVQTILEVEKEGHIFIEEGYINTTIIVGKKQFVLDKDFKNIHAYLKKSELIVEKLLL